MIENKWIYLIIIIIIIVIIIIFIFCRKGNDCDDKSECSDEKSQCSDDKSQCSDNRPDCPIKRPDCPIKRPDCPIKRPDCPKPRLIFKPLGFVQRKEDNNFEAEVAEKEHVKPDIVVLNPSIEKSTTNLKSLFEKHIDIPNELPGSGVKIAIISAYINPNIKKDLLASLKNDEIYSNTDISLLKQKIENNIAIINENNNSPIEQHAWNLQQTMEIQVLFKLCPNAKIYLLQAKSSHIEDILSAVQFACDPIEVNEHGVFGLGVHVVNLAWGGDISCLNENNEIYAGSCRADQIFTDYPDVIFSSSSGNKVSKTQWPSVNPYVIACGGLEFNDDKIQGWSSSGSGVDENYPANAATDFEFRNVPDVAGIANPLNGVTIHHNGFEVVVGGTALACTLFTAFVAIINSKRLQKNECLLTQELVFETIYKSQDLFGTENKKYNSLTGMGLFFV